MGRLRALFLRQTEVPMTIDSDHHATEAEDAMFDSSMKITGIVVVLVGIVAAIWYFAG
jgi:hypothetical protein